MNDLSKFVSNKQSAIAVARLVAFLACAVGSVFGWKFDADLIFNIVLSVIAVAILVYFVWWKNANITKASQLVQEILGGLKSGDVSECKVETVLDEDAECEVGEDDEGEGDTSDQEDAPEPEGVSDDYDPEGVESDADSEPKG